MGATYDGDHDMVMLSVYQCGDLIIIPTMAKTDAGFHLQIEPVYVANRASLEELVAALKSGIANANPPIKTPPRDSFPKPVVPGYAGFRSWAAFEKKALCWDITINTTTVELRKQSKAKGGGWEDRSEHVELFSGDAALEELANSLMAQCP